MPAIRPRVLITDERQRPMQQIDVHCIERASGNVLMRATTGNDGIANFDNIDESKEFWFRPMGSRNQNGGAHGHLRVSVLPKADSDTLPPTAMDSENEEEGDPVAYLVFTTRPYHVEKNVMTGFITVQRRDLTNTPIKDGTQVVYLYTTSAGGQFWANLGAGDVVVTQMTIANGSSTTSFKYKDSETGNPVLTASTEALT